MPATVLLGGDQPWLRRLLGISVAPQVGSIFNEAVRGNTAKQWNGIATWRTTRSNANNHRRYLMTRTLCTVAWPLGGSSWPLWRPRWEIIPLRLQGRCRKILYCNRCGVRLGAHNASDGEEAHNLFWA